MKFSRRGIMDRLVAALCLVAAFFSAGLLFVILGYLFVGALPALTINFILMPESALHMVDGAIENAIAGTIIISILATLISAPFAFGTAVYLAKYAPKNRFTDTVRFFIEVLSGTPSIVVGVFGFLVLVVYLKPFTGGYSLIAGAIGLAILIMPVIERGAEEAIQSIPLDLEEGSYALGADKWQTIHLVTIPAAISGIITGVILGFGRAAEESAVVIFTAGYTQFMPEFAIKAYPNMFLGLRIYPLQDSIATLPLSVYNAYENSNVVPMSHAFAAAFVLICIVLVINIIAKTIARQYVTSGDGGDSVLKVITGKLSFSKASIPDITGDIAGIEKIPAPFIRQSVILHNSPEPSHKANHKGISTTLMIAGAEFKQDGHVESPSSISTDDIRHKEPDTTAADTKKEEPPAVDVRSVHLAPVDLSWIDTEPLLDEPSSGETQNTEPPKTTPNTTRITVHSVGTGVVRLITAVREKARRMVHDTMPKKAPAHAAAVRGSPDITGALPKRQPFNIGTIRGSARSFLTTFAPFALVAAILMALTVMLPALSPFGSNGPAGSLTVPGMALILAMIGTVCALFLVRNSTLFLLRRRKGRIGNRSAEFVAVALGICVVLVSAFIFSAHIFSSAPSIQSPSSGTIPESGTGSEATPQTGIFSYFVPSGSGGFFGITEMINFNSLFGFLHLPGLASTNNAAASTNQSDRLAALLASEETPPEATVQSTPAASQASPAPSSPEPVSSVAPAVPVKFALDLGESYWYGDNSRPCLATVYNATTLPFYFWWDMDWNRFVQQTPATSGDVFLVVFIRIEDTGNMSAIVPSADQFIVTNNGQTYTHNIYFDTSVLSQNEINYYTANYNALPYQWIREIGGQKRDYAFLTGYNVFGQNQTVVENYTTNSAVSPPSASNPNGEGYFIQPGRSNAIDGYLIYEVPDAVAADLKDTYVQVSFNSFSATQWRLGK